MAVNDLKVNFQNQLKEIDEKIAQIQGEMEKAKEYKLKLLGGLETLELLSQTDEETSLEDVEEAKVYPELSETEEESE